MVTQTEKILILETDESSRATLVDLLQAAGYQVEAPLPNTEAVQSARQSGPSLLLLDQNLPSVDCREFLLEWKSATATQSIPVFLLVTGASAERALVLDLGADDVLSRPFDSGELLARIRAQLRLKRAADELRDKAKIAEEGQHIAHTAFEALAVTEKMTKDAFSLGRVLKIGVAAVFVVAAVMAVTFFLYSHSAKKQQDFANSVIRHLGGPIRQQSVMADARKLRGQSPAITSAGGTNQRDELQKQANQLKAQIANADEKEIDDLQHQLTETNARLKKVEAAGTAAEGIIGANEPSVCLLHVAVAFREKDSGLRLRYAGINPQGDPLEDSDGNPVLTLEGHGPEVRLDVFGTGFLAGPSGKLITNRHVAQPWWKNDEMGSLINQGFQPEIAVIRAYFPGDSRALHAEIEKISDETDLASMHVDLDGLVRPVLSVDRNKDAAKSGESIVLMGYATGLAGILARADESSAQQIMAKSDGDVSAILDELARRNLIRPIVTQGHVGDVLTDKIVFDAQTTSGGSGGPLLDSDGKVIGVTYAVLSGFGGSNFGIPARFATPLLAQ
ncbi:MAG: trypsin-like peptidase domain-containing protein [Candidatus Acidiferrales bacterium]|jgi:DNA-binding response OmpR family regulator/S1-C subfamily serine protease